MCNACGFFCCAYDGFQGCGCDHCPNRACWSDDDDDFGYDDFDYDEDHGRMELKARRRRRFVCDSPSSGDGLGIHQPGSNTRGGFFTATAPSGRARDRAKCPAVARSNEGRRA